MNKLERNKKYSNQSFEDIKHIDENGIEFWFARELQLVLDYKEWRKFVNVIKKAIDACENSGISAFEHFVDADKLSKRANNEEVFPREDFYLCVEINKFDFVLRVNKDKDEMLYIEKINI